MRRSLALAPFALTFLLACGAGTAKPADGPESEAAGTPPGGEPAATTEAPAPTPTVKRIDPVTDLSTDDYSLTENDCQALGRQYGDAARADQRVGLNPKLTDKQREQANASIDSVVSKLETTWIDTCVKNLAGKNVEHKNITCALAAKTVKSFDVCLNGQKKP
jgi:hypothetical protein